MASMSTLDLHDEWIDVLRRRPTLHGTLSVYSGIIDGWARTVARVAPLAWNDGDCRRAWERHVPLLGEAPPQIPVDDAEALVEIGLQALATLGEGQDALARFVGRWDEGVIGPGDLLPGKGRIGAASLVDEIGLRSGAVEFLAVVTLRPLLESYFSGVRGHLIDGAWPLGICPFCGAPPGFADVVEDGARRLACHLCGGTWRFSRTRCPFCGTEASKDLVRLELGDKEAAYFVAACKACLAYIKELDRRMRWNGGSALVEDWASPHFDLVAQREGYWRPGGSLVHLTARN